MLLKYCTICKKWYSTLLGFSEVSFSPISINIASKHLQYGIVTGLITVCGLTIGFAGAEDSMLPPFALSFIQTTANTVQDGPFAGAKFDIGGYMSHPCYDIAGVEAKTCKDQFGLTEPLKTYIENGSLLSYLQANGLALGGMPVMSSSSSMTSVSSAMSSSSSMMSETSSSSSAMSEATAPVTTILNDAVHTQADFDQLRQNRSHDLWTVCDNAYEGRYNKAACYQQNISLLMRYDTPIDGNVQLDMNQQ